MIGRYPAITLPQAYETHVEYIKRLNRGEDLRALRERGAVPGVETPAGMQARQVTVGELAAEFVRRYVNRERKHPEEAEWAIEFRRAARPRRGLTRRPCQVLLASCHSRGTRLPLQ